MSKRVGTFQPLLCLASRLFPLYMLRSCIFPRSRQWFDVLGAGREEGSNDITSTTGFLVCIRDVLRIRSGGVLWGGVPCNRWLSEVQAYDSTCVLCPPVSPDPLTVHVQVYMCFNPSWIWMSSGSHLRHLCILGNSGSWFAVPCC